MSSLYLFDMSHSQVFWKRAVRNGSVHRVDSPVQLPLHRYPDVSPGSQHIAELYYTKHALRQSHVRRVQRR